MKARIRPKYEMQTRSRSVPKLKFVKPEPVLGAHLVTPRTGYTHHGIYVGAGKVVHYSGWADDLKAGAIEETTLEAFSSGQGYEVKNYANPRFTGEAVVERAYSRLGEDLYSVFSNNCEHFCKWCIDDEHHSEQVENVKGAGTRGVVAFTLLRTVSPPMVSIPLSIAYATYCLLQNNKDGNTVV